MSPAPTRRDVIAGGLAAALAPTLAARAFAGEPLAVGAGHTVAILADGAEEAAVADLVRQAADAGLRPLVIGGALPARAGSAAHATVSPAALLALPPDRLAAILTAGGPRAAASVALAPPSAAAGRPSETDVARALGRLLRRLDPSLLAVLRTAAPWPGDEGRIGLDRLAGSLREGFGDEAGAITIRTLGLDIARERV